MDHCLNMFNDDNQTMIHMTQPGRDMYYDGTDCVRYILHHMYFHIKMPARLAFRVQRLRLSRPRCTGPCNGRCKTIYPRRPQRQWSRSCSRERRGRRLPRAQHLCRRSPSRGKTCGAAAERRILRERESEVPAASEVPAVEAQFVGPPDNDPYDHCLNTIEHRQAMIHVAIHLVFFKLHGKPLCYLKKRSKTLGSFRLHSKPLRNLKKRCKTLGFFKLHSKPLCPRS